MGQPWILYNHAQKVGAKYTPKINHGRGGSLYGPNSCRSNGQTSKRESEHSGPPAIMQQCMRSVHLRDKQDQHTHKRQPLQDQTRQRVALPPVTYVTRRLAEATSERPGERGALCARCPYISLRASRRTVWASNRLRLKDEPGLTFGPSPRPSHPSVRPPTRLPPLAPAHTRAVAYAHRRTLHPHSLNPDHQQNPPTRPQTTCYSQSATS